MEYSTALVALEKAAPHLTELEVEALSKLLSLFEPYAGDDPQEARQRDHMKAHCYNCAFETPLMFFPAIADRATRTAIRLAVCPRCFSTQMMCGASPTTIASAEVSDG